MYPETTFGKFQGKPSCSSISLKKTADRMKIRKKKFNRLE